MPVTGTSLMFMPMFTKTCGEQQSDNAHGQQSAEGVLARAAIRRPLKSTRPRRVRTITLPRNPSSAMTEK